MFNLSFNLIKKIKKKFFPFYKNKELKFVFKTLQQGYENETIVARFVGGCVRKHLSGEDIDDIDIATIFTTEQIKEKFKNTNVKILDTGLKHGTVTLMTKNYKLEITTLRKDIKTDGRHAEVEYTDDWQVDSERRDFTINAIYMDINGKIFDPQMGTVDLKTKNIKFIGDPQKRIEEDYLRIIRFIRFKITYDTNIEKTTEDALKLNLDGIKKISKERILTELLKILSLKHFLKINKNNQLKEIFLQIFPEFIHLNRLERLSKVYKYFTIDTSVLLATMLIDKKGNHEYFSHKYNVSNIIKDNLEEFAKDLNMAEKDKNFLTKELRKNIYILGKNRIEALSIINFAISSKTKLQEFLTLLKKVRQFNVPKFPIDGDFLKKNGMKEGALLGKVLKLIEKEWVNNSFKISNDRVRELIKTNLN